MNFARLTGAIDMAKPRQIKDSFEKIIADNTTALGKVNDTLRTTRSNRERAVVEFEEQLASCIEDLLTPAPDIRVLDAISNATAVNVAILYRDLKSGSQEAERAYDALVVAHGDVDHHTSVVSEVDAQLKEVRERHTAQKQQVNATITTIKPVVQFNEKYADKRQITTEESVAYFNSKGIFGYLWAAMFDGHYMEGRKALRACTNADVPAAYAQKEAGEKALDNLQVQMDALTERKAPHLKILQEMKTVGSQILGEEEINVKLGKAIFKAMGSTENLNAVAKVLGEQVPEEVLQARAKVDALGKIEKGLNLRAGILDRANTDLSKNLPKLRTAVSRGVQKDVRIDLDKIERSMKAQQVMAKHEAQEMKKANDNIVAFDHKKAKSMPSQASSASSGNYHYTTSDFFFDWMIYSMIFDLHHHHHCDAHSVNSVMGISDTVATDANIDLADLTPDISAVDLGGLSADFNGLDMSDLLKDINLDSGMLDGFELPSFDIDIGGMDFDIGGGFDF